MGLLELFHCLSAARNMLRLNQKVAVCKKTKQLSQRLYEMILCGFVTISYLFHITHNDLIHCQYKNRAALRAAWGHYVNVPVVEKQAEMIPNCFASLLYTVLGFIITRAGTDLKQGSLFSCYSS